MDLSETLRRYLIDEGLYVSGSGSGHALLEQLGIERDTMFAEFFTHGAETSYVGARGHEIDDIVWMIENSSYHEQRDTMITTLGLPQTMISMDSFEGGGGFFYSTSDGGVYEIELGEKLQRVIAGEATANWPDFDSFLRWFFDVDG